TFCGHLLYRRAFRIFVGVLAFAAQAAIGSSWLRASSGAQVGKKIVISCCCVLWALAARSAAPKLKQFVDLILEALLGTVLGYCTRVIPLKAPGEAFAEASVPMLRGLARGLAELPSCAEKPDFHLARASWCGEQKEPMACSKDVDSPNPIWDCHLQAEVSSDWQNQNAQGQATRFVTWNLYVFTLAGRIHPVVDELLRMQPEIAAIPEMWHEKGAILDVLNQRSGNVWAFATGGATEQFNDADILFRTDKWEHIASDLVPFSAGRAINWAALRRKSDGYALIASGTHPLCCQGDYVITEAVDFVTKTLSQVQNRHPYPIVLMGDLNTGYFQPSQQLLRQGQVEAFGRHWQIPMTFTDAWAELHPGNPDPSTINDDPVRLDYVYFQKTPFSVGQSIVQSQIWPRAAGSDHRAVSGDVVLNRRPRRAALKFWSAALLVSAELRYGKSAKFGKGIVLVAVLIDLIRDPITQTLGPDYAGWDGYAFLTIGIPVALLLACHSNGCTKLFLVINSALLGAILATDAVAAIAVCLDANEPL
ncbi:unnamed protein product, partial [Symbiodinium sp. KB8]